jgi:hypothetical protein
VALVAGLQALEEPHHDVITSRFNPAITNQTDTAVL